MFSDPIPDKRAIAEIAAASDVCMTIYKDVPILYTCSPNKLFDTFAAGRAAIVNTPGWLTELVEQNEAGVAVRPGDPADLADKVGSPAATTPSWCAATARTRGGWPRRSSTATGWPRGSSRCSSGRLRAA